MAILVPLSVSGPAATIVHRAPADFAGARVQGLAPLPFSEGLWGVVRGSGSIESAAIEAPAPFDDLVGSWNADLPEGTALELRAQVRLPRGWSPWFTLGMSSGSAYRSPGAQENPWGMVDVDTLKLKGKADAFRYAILLNAGSRRARLRLAAFALSAEPSPAPPEAFVPGPWVRELKPRPRSQMTEQEEFRHDICSPTSLAMALEHWGERRATARVAESVLDRATGKYGVWPANAAAASARGLEAYVARLGSLAELQEEIAAGRPVVSSLTFGPGELEGAPLAKTRGHLLLVTGFTQAGDVIALDPAAPRAREARRVYRREQFDRAWRVNKRGLAYLVSPRLARPLAVGTPRADLWSKPRSGPDEERLSQLLYGEAVSAVRARGDWVEVRALEQPDYRKGRRWQGYPGWISARALASAPPRGPLAAIRTREAALMASGDPGGSLVLSLGTRLPLAQAAATGPAAVRLMDGRVASAPRDSMAEPPADEAGRRAAVVAAARQLLDIPYVWGGASGLSLPSPGLDCSGLVRLAYRAAGLDLPRDAHEQRLRSRRLPPWELKPGDLVFLSEDADSGAVTHVMIYAGGAELLESRLSAGRSLSTTFPERLGRPLHELAWGAVVTDPTGAKPRKRRVYFGRYL